MTGRMTFATRLFARREFTLPDFDLQPLEFDADGSSTELLLDRVVESGTGESNVISLARPLPTAGELHKSIELHLEAARGRDSHDSPPTPAEELRSALAELRRSLG